LLNQVIKLMLHALKHPFFLNESYFLLLQNSFFLRNNCFQLYFTIGFFFSLFVQIAVSKIKTFQCRFCQFNT